MTLLLSSQLSMRALTQTGLTASRSGNNITFKGENVQSLTIGQKSNAEISDTLVSEVNAKGASNAVTCTLPSTQVIFRLVVHTQSQSPTVVMPRHQTFPSQSRQS